MTRVMAVFARRRCRRGNSCFVYIAALRLAYEVFPSPFDKLRVRFDRLGGEEWQVRKQLLPVSLFSASRSKSDQRMGFLRCSVIILVERAKIFFQLVETATPAFVHALHSGHEGCALNLCGVDR